MSSRLHDFIGAAFTVLTLVALSATMPDPLAVDAAIEQRRTLRAFDRFLDHHPQIEDELRLKPALRREPRYLAANPELNSFLATTPDLAAALQTYPRYFLYRALLRQAHTPLKHSEIAQLSDLFDRQPALERALTHQPDAIRDAAFLETQPLLREFLQTQSLLVRAFPSRP